jgi:fatty-acyl-CoA synthase
MILTNVPCCDGLAAGRVATAATALAALQSNFMPAPPLLTAEVVQDAGAGVRPHGKFSFVAGRTEPPLRFVTLPQMLDETVAAWGARPAAIFCVDPQVLTWNDLKRQSDQFAAALLAAGLRRGDRLALCTPSRKEWLLAFFGAARVGVVLVLLDPNWRSNQLESALNKLECRALLLARRTAQTDLLGQLRQLAPELDQPGAAPVLASERFPHLQHVIFLDEGLVPARARRFSDLMMLGTASIKQRLPGFSAALDADDVICVQFTAGTSGTPRGVAQSHFSLANNAVSVARSMELGDRDKLCIPLPMHHTFGIAPGVLACAATGAAMVFPGERFDVTQTLDAVSRHRCTALHGAPAMFEALLHHPELEHYDTSSLRTGIMAGAHCTESTLMGVMQDLCMDEVTVAYGLTETAPVSFQCSVDDDPELRLTTVGRIQPHLEAKVIDAQGRIVPVGAQGELCTRGYSVMRGYWAESRRSRQALDAQGWMHTGDLASIDAEGYCRLHGRVADCFDRGDVRINPCEIENRLREHPKVKSAQVFGVPDAEFGEEVCAWIVLKAGETMNADEVIHFCAPRDSKALPRWHVRFVTTIPRTVTGTVRKYLMRAAMLREMAAAPSARASA